MPHPDQADTYHDFINELQRIWMDSESERLTLASLLDGPPKGWDRQQWLEAVADAAERLNSVLES